jgi:hypothetical protein
MQYRGDNSMKKKEIYGYFLYFFYHVTQNFHMQGRPFNEGKNIWGFFSSLLLLSDDFLKYM